MVEMSSFQENLHSAAILLSICLVCQCQFPPLEGSGLPFQEPRNIVSSDGRLDMQLDVDVGEVSVDWLTTKRRLYNNSFPAPTVRIRPGDRWHLHLANKLKHPDFVDEHGFSNPNTTNVHTHGLHISSEEPQDSQKVVIGPESSYDYYYEVNEEQPAGTYWYHPHHHGSSHFQTISGMHGMIVVEDDADEEIAAIDDVVVVTSLFNYMDDEDTFIEAEEDINDIFRLNATLEDWLLAVENGVLYMLVNGLREPTMDMETGVFKRFRIVNTGGVHSLAVHLTNTEEKGCQFYEIALDGVYLPEARVPALERSLIVAGGRADFLIRCPYSGTYQLESSFIEADEQSLGDHPSFNGLLMTLNVVGDAADKEEVPPPQLPKLPDFFDDLRRVSDDEIAGRFAVEINAASSMNREHYSGMLEESWRYKAEVGTIQEMILTNTEVDDSHPIHMHINHMQVISYNEYTGPVGNGGREWALFDQSGEECTYQHPAYDSTADVGFPRDALLYLGHEERLQGESSLGYAQIGEWRDTLLIPPLANITVRFRTHEYTGPVLIHCHIGEHADEGMMEVIGIVPKGADLTANITSEGVYPWACMENNPIGEPLENAAAERRSFLDFLNDIFECAVDVFWQRFS